ncbi:MAG: hypothetical protein NTW25_11410 [Candidatus Kapabacteria bacterium]|jgi:hypothetical protein|nr:hypothetical protein [Candidatus Kapabacteria bacterium]
MAEQISTSTNPFDYEILIRKRGEGQYASYCPQINQMLTGTEHVEVQKLMETKVNSYIDSIKSQEVTN